jgi:HTH-type transcriptional regulator/antitoxin HigA
VFRTEINDVFTANYSTKSRIIMKFSISKEWLLKRAHLEEGLEIGAGGLLDKRLGQQFMDWDLFPIKEMYKRNWFEGFTGSLSAAMTEAEPLVMGFMERALKRPFVALQRQRVRSGAEADPYALLAWQCRVISLSKSSPPQKEFRHQVLDDAWLNALVQLSRFADGPLRAKQHLREAGIAFVVEPHLSSTHLDGAALLSPERPVVALTLRYDRLDNFWFVLLHEIIHVKKHLKKGTLEDIFDDLEAKPDDLEREADDLACEVLIPANLWNTALARYVRSEGAVKALAAQMKISPSIVAGRIRNEAGNYVILGNLVGQGEVRKLFPEVHFGRI